MKQFETGHFYNVNGGGMVYAEKVTACYVTLTGDFSGRYKINRYGDNGLFGLGEYIALPSAWAGGKYFCFAAHEYNFTEEK